MLDKVQKRNFIPIVFGVLSVAFVLLSSFAIKKNPLQLYGWFF